MIILGNKLDEDVCFVNNGGHLIIRQGYNINSHKNIIGEQFMEIEGKGTQLSQRNGIFCHAIFLLPKIATMHICKCIYANMG